MSPNLKIPAGGACNPRPSTVQKLLKPIGYADAVEAVNGGMAIPGAAGSGPGNVDAAQKSGANSYPVKPFSARVSNAKTGKARAAAA